MDAMITTEEMEARIERTAESMMDSADEQLQNGEISQGRYEALLQEMNDWEDLMYEEMRKCR